MARLRVGSRESALAQVQARHVMALLEAAWPGLDLSLQTYKTTGDVNLEIRLSEIGDKGLFVKELETALLAREIDLAVHSLKDMPSELPDGLALVSAGRREDPRDVLIARNPLTLEDLPPGASVGTGSIRRTAILKGLRPDLRYENIRGNLQTRYRKLEEGQFDAIVLAAAGVHRLGWEERITQYFDPARCLPAPGQGILAVEYRTADAWTSEYLKAIIQPDVEAAMTAERAVLETVEGGCQVPLGAYAEPLDENRLFLRGVLLAEDGSNKRQGERTGSFAEARHLGEALARKLRQ